MAEIASATVEDTFKSPPLPSMTVSQIKRGDVLIRENDSRGRPDARVTVLEKKTDGRVRFKLDGGANYFYRVRFVWGSDLTSQRFTIIERAGQRIGRFFVAYW